MRKMGRDMILAAGLAGVMIAAGGCGDKKAAGTESTAAVTEAAVEVTTGAGETTTGTGASDAQTASNDVHAPGAVWFDKDTGEAHGDIADMSEREETTAETGSGPAAETDVNVPVKIWGGITSIQGSTLTVDNQSDASVPGEMLIHMAPERSYIVDAVSGLPVDVADVEPGSFVAYLAPAITMSLPPQATARVVIVNIPEDAAAPEYVVAAGGIEDTGEGKVLRCLGDRQYALAEDVTVEPFMTKNIVTLDDIGENIACLLWLDEAGETVERIVLFAGTAVEAIAD